MELIPEFVERGAGNLQRVLLDPRPRHARLLQRTPGTNVVGGAPGNDGGNRLVLRKVAQDGRKRLGGKAPLPQEAFSMLMPTSMTSALAS